MHVVQPKVFMIAGTNVYSDPRDEMLSALGVPENWDTDAKTAGEGLIELAGRLCYKAFGTELNANLTKVRGGNKDYLQNILKQHHGSVLEHSTVTFALLNVSRVLTHEEVRHRAGTAFSQESMRFVRIDDMPISPPELKGALIRLSKIVNASKLNTNEEHELWAQGRAQEFWSKFVLVVREAEEGVKNITQYLDVPGVPFSLKKEITTELRRIAPHGIATNIVVTANHRAWRHMLEMRTSGGADREIRQVFQQIGIQLQQAFPNIYQDMTYDDDDGSFVFEHSKV